MEGSAPSPREVLDLMLKRDRFTQWLGLEIDEIGDGYCKLHYLVTDSMLNGFEQVHGGVLFSAADSAFALHVIPMASSQWRWTSIYLLPGLLRPATC